MNTVGPITLRLSADTRMVMIIVRLMSPLVLLGVLSPERAGAFASRFVRVKVRQENGEEISA
jgi:hypothetical protein